MPQSRMASDMLQHFDFYGKIKLRLILVQEGNIMRKVLKGVGIFLLVVVLAAAGFIGYLTVTEFRPEDEEPLAVVSGTGETLHAGDTLRVMTFNTGYAGLDAAEDFFMDGGTMSRPEGGTEKVQSNMEAILGAIKAENAQIVLLQEVDKDSSRSGFQDQTVYYQSGTGMASAFALNYRCNYVPYPIPPIGKVKSGIMTLTAYEPTEATRQSLPVPFSWPIRVANLKRCLLVERIPVEGTEKELVVVNLHLEAYDDGEGKIAQTQRLYNFIKNEYDKGNYVIAGGDFNQTFSDVQHIGGSWEGKWTPGLLDEVDLPEGITLVYDHATPTCRSLDQRYTGDREQHVFYIIDGFLVSGNVQVEDVHTVDLDFAASDHNPVVLQVTLAE